MKKKVLSIFVAMLMLATAFSALSMTASAKTSHDLTVKKAGVAATEGSDYEWEDGACLRIKVNGLTVSGTTTTEHIEVNGATELTIENLSVQTDGDPALHFEGGSSNSYTLTVKGNNILDTSNDAIDFSGHGKITGDGNLTLIAGEFCCGIYSNDDITLDCSGVIKADSDSRAAFSGKNINVTANTGKIYACSSCEQGVFSWGTSKTLTVAKGLTMTGSAEYRRVEAATNAALTIGEDKVVDADGNGARTVLIGKRVLDLLKENNYPSVSANGWVNEKGLKSFFFPGSDYLIFDHTGHDTSAVVLKSGNSYVYEEPDMFRMTFNMKNGSLESIKYEHLGDNPADMDGTYKPVGGSGKTPKTGDASNLMLWLALMGMAFVGFASCFVVAKNK